MLLAVGPDLESISAVAPGLSGAGKVRQRLLDVARALRRRATNTLGEVVVQPVRKVSAAAGEQPTKFDYLRKLTGAQGPVKSPSRLVGVLAEPKPDVTNLDVLRALLQTAREAGANVGGKLIVTKPEERPPAADLSAGVSQPRPASRMAALPAWAMNAAKSAGAGLAGIARGLGCAECGGTCGKRAARGLGCVPCMLPLLAGESGLGTLGKINFNIAKFFDRATHKVPILNNIAKNIPKVSPAGFVKDPIGSVASMAAFIGRITNPIGVVQMGLMAPGEPMPEGFAPFDQQFAAMQVPMMQAPMAPESAPAPELPEWARPKNAASMAAPTVQPPCPYPYPQFWPQFIPQLQDQLAGPF